MSARLRVAVLLISSAHSVVGPENYTETKVRLRKLLDKKSGGSGPIRWLLQGLDAWYSNADDGKHGAELWESDLSLEHTRMVKDIRPGNEGSYPSQLCQFKGHIYFSANDGLHGIEMWRTDGSRRNTTVFHDINVGAAGSYPQGMTDCGGTHMFFAATDGTVTPARP